MTSATGSKHLIAVVQLCATLDIKRNINQGVQCIRNAAARGCKMIFMPEASDFMGTSSKDTIANTHSLDSSPFVKAMQAEAKVSGISVAVGVHETGTIPDRAYNTQLVIDHDGQIKATYRKLHLFDVDIKDGPRVMESDIYQKGDTIIPPVQTVVGKLGLNICYDIRFAMQAMKLADDGADILTYPSAFTVKTGGAHWETLLRARAIENQRYVVAAAQAGKHNEKRESWGHAMVIDPWGTKLCETSTFSPQEPAIGYAEIDLGLIGRIESSMPLRSHRRPDLFK